MHAQDLRPGWVTLAVGVGLLEISLWAGAANYGRAAEPLARPVFLPLPPGAVEPAGWLRDWAIAAREGITGHLDEYHPVYGEAWKGTPVKAPNAAPESFAAASSSARARSSVTSTPLPAASPSVFTT